MKNKYKITLVSALLSFVLGSFAFAAENNLTKDARNWSRIDRAYTSCLRHGNNDVVESALVNALKIDLFETEAELPKVLKEVKRLTRKGRTASIRYKAFLVLNVIKNPEWVSSSQMTETLDRITDEDREKFFESLSVVINESLINN